MRLRDQPMPTAEESLRRMKQLISPRVGIARTIAQIPLSEGDPPLYIFGVEGAGTGPLGVPLPRTSSGGAGLTLAEGLVSALGELVEGYCGSWTPRERMILGTYRELASRHHLLHPERFALFSESQYSRPNFPFQRFTEDTPVFWVEGYSLVEERAVLVPASRVYMPYPKTAEEADIGPNYSTGLATGASLEHAILSGLYECFERDAFTIFWMNDLPVRRINLRASSPELPVMRLFHERLDVPGYEYRVYDITNDLGVTTTYVILISPAPRNILVHVVGASSRLDGGLSVSKSLVEAVQGKPYVVHEIQREPDWKPAPDFSNVNQFSITCKLYTVMPELRPHLLGVEGRVSAEVTVDQLPRWESKGQGQGQGMVAEIRELVGRLKARGYEAAVVDVTTPDIASIGLRVARVVTPELQQLHASARWAFLGGRRLYEVPVRLGARPTLPTESDLSSYPHPFP